jgi:hypothetical protein
MCGFAAALVCDRGCGPCVSVALAASGLDHVNVRQRSDNGSSYVAYDPATWFKGKDMQHVRGAPEVAARAVSPANRRLPASRNSLEQP